MAGKPSLGVQGPGQAQGTPEPAARSSDICPAAASGCLGSRVGTEGHRAGSSVLMGWDEGSKWQVRKQL